MDNWEEELRDKLHKELIEGLHDICDHPSKVVNGSKAEKIEFEVNKIKNKDESKDTK